MTGYGVVAAHILALPPIKGMVAQAESDPDLRAVDKVSRLQGRAWLETEVTLDPALLSPDKDLGA